MASSFSFFVTIGTEPLRHEGRVMATFGGCICLLRSRSNKEACAIDSIAQLTSLPLGVLWSKVERMPHPCVDGTCSRHDCTLGGNSQGKFCQPVRLQLPKWVLSWKGSPFSPDSSTLMGSGKSPSGAILVTVNVCVSGKASPTTSLASIAFQ